MEATNVKQKMLLIAILAIGLMIGGCSQLNSDNPEGNGDLGITGSTAEGQEIVPPFNLTHYPYPEAADNPPDGFLLIPIGVTPAERSVDDPYGDEWAADMINKSKGGEIWLDDDMSGIVIEPWGVPNSGWIALTRPDSVEPWIEFEPHGLVFESPQVARVSYAGYGLPEGIDPNDLTIWYWIEESGEYEYIGGTVYPDEEYVEFNIEHFSRYIVAGQE